jgi:hypothetical protein
MFNSDSITEGMLVEVEHFNDKRVRETITVKVLKVAKDGLSFKGRMPRGVFKTYPVSSIKKLCTDNEGHMIELPEGTVHVSMIAGQSEAISSTPSKKDKMKKLGEEVHAGILDGKKDISPEAKKIVDKVVNPPKDRVEEILQKINNKEKAPAVHKAADLMEQVDEASKAAEERLKELKPSLKKQAAKNVKEGKPEKPLKVTNRLYSGQELKDKVLECVLGGMTNRQISDQLGCHQSTVSETKAKLVKEGKLEKRS